ncbi:RNA-directed DNA polymerase, eukaryota [Tanacetum coccineum]
MVGEYSSRIKAWDDVILKLRSRLSKWKVKTLSIGGRLTLLKSVLGASPIYNMSIFKVPTGVLKVMESIRSRFFNGDRWVCDLVSDGNFRVKEIRNYIDDLFLPHQAAQTRWIKYIPIKVNIFAWRARQDCLPTRVNLIRRGITIESSLCPVCSVCEEDVCHIFFHCDLAQLVLRRICRWWGLDPHDWSSFQEWQSWIPSIQLSSKVKAMLEGVFFVSWWFIWNFRNRIIFEESPPRRSENFDAIVVAYFEKEIRENIRVYDAIMAKWKISIRPKIDAFSVVYDSVQRMGENGSCNLDVFTTRKHGL